MKLIPWLSTVILSLAIATPAMALYPDHEAFCQDFARYAEQDAKYRDKGLTQTEMQDILDEIEDDRLRGIRTIALAYVFRYPKLTPQEEGNAAYAECIDLVESDDTST